MKNKNILIIAPHADDEVIGCGGFISKYKNQNNIHILYITHPSFAQQKGFRTLGDKVKDLTILSFCFPDQKLENESQSDIINIIRNCISKWKIDTVFMPYMYDANTDHQVVAKCAIVACRPFDSGVKNLLMYEVPETTMLAHIPFKPNYFVQLNGFKGKEMILNCYSDVLTDDNHPRSIGFLKLKSKMYAEESGLKHYAEAFQIVRMTES